MNCTHSKDKLNLNFKVKSVTNFVYEHYGVSNNII